MKGTVFQKPLELKINVDGESWRQGDPISGSLSAKNHGSEPVSLAGLDVRLAEGTLSKVRQKSPGAFDLIATAPLEGPGTLDPQKEANFTWRFQTDVNCPVTDSTGSLFLLYGQGQLQLTVLPHEVIEEFLQTLEVGFRFVRKTVKSTKRGVEVKYAPPEAKAFALLESLTVGFKLDSEQGLEVKFTFQQKKLEASAASIDVKKLRREAARAFPRALYRLPSGRIDHAAFEKGIQEILDGHLA